MITRLIFRWRLRRFDAAYFLPLLFRLLSGSGGYATFHHRAVYAHAFHERFSRWCHSPRHCLLLPRRVLDVDFPVPASFTHRRGRAAYERLEDGAARRYTICVREW